MILTVGGLRGLLEQFLQIHATFGVSSLLHYSLFYLAGYFIINAWLPRLAGRPWQALFWPSVLGVCAGLLPPLLDLPVNGLHAVKYTYPFGFEPVFYTFGLAGSGLRQYQISFGEGSAVWLTITALVAYTGWATRSWWRAGLALPLAWGSMQLVSYVSFALVGWANAQLNTGVTGRVGRDGMAVLIFCGEALVLYLLQEPRRLRAALAKSLHAVPFALTVLIGGAAAGGLGPAHGVFAAALVGLTWLLIIQNNVYDRVEDQAGGLRHGLDEVDARLGHVIALPLILGLVFMRDVPGILLGLYYLVWTLYHLPGLRLKRHFPLPYLIEGLTGALAIVCGIALAAPNQQLHNLRDPALALLALAALAGYGASSVLKDYKDIDGDRAGQIRTLHTWLLDHGWSLAAIQRLVAAQVTASHLVLIAIAAWLGAAPWQAGLAAALTLVGFPYLLLGPVAPRRAVEACLVLDALVLGWFLLVLPPLTGRW